MWTRFLNAIKYVLFGIEPEPSYFPLNPKVGEVFFRDGMVYISKTTPNSTQPYWVSLGRCWVTPESNVSDPQLGDVCVEFRTSDIYRWDGEDWLLELVWDGEWVSCEELKLITESMLDAYEVDNE